LSTARKKKTVYIEAAGGYVIRGDVPDIDLLMIFRRGKWDLPKGKFDAGETRAECALREVEEETGAEGLTILASAGSTKHGYVEKGRNVEKTTWWFLMHTTASSFMPQAEESIERVDWVPWAEARKRVGYESLRKHMKEVEKILNKTPL